MEDMQGSVVSVSSNNLHGFSKRSRDVIVLVAGMGVEGDAHFGKTVKHRSRVAVDPRRPNLRQVHLLQVELFAELSLRGFNIAPGELGENITTRNLPLLDLPTGTHLVFSGSAVLELTGLRNPCQQIDAFRPGLFSAVVDTDNNGKTIRKCGVMAVVVSGGEVRSGDEISVLLPEEPHLPLVRV